MDNFNYKKYIAEGKLLKEASDSPKAIILAGAPGAGRWCVARDDPEPRRSPPGWRHHRSAPRRALADVDRPGSPPAGTAAHR